MDGQLQGLRKLGTKQRQREETLPEHRDGGLVDALHGRGHSAGDRGTGHCGGALRAGAKIQIQYVRYVLHHERGAKHLPVGNDAVPVRSALLLHHQEQVPENRPGTLPEDGGRPQPVAEHGPDRRPARTQAGATGVHPQVDAVPRPARRAPEHGRNGARKGGRERQRAQQRFDREFVANRGTEPGGHRGTIPLAAVPRERPRRGAPAARARRRPAPPRTGRREVAHRQGSDGVLRRDADPGRHPNRGIPCLSQAAIQGIGPQRETEGIRGGIHRDRSRIAGNGSLRKQSRRPEREGGSEKKTIRWNRVVSLSFS
mmetsp:Transcript_343/g.702  ORF Transcript_343/g.702 Transcript_343/m.702 type:complete len:314 (+) Transcript_343:1217-2158(+)